MEQEEIIIKKGKKVKQTKQIKLRDYNMFTDNLLVSFNENLIS